MKKFRLQMPCIVKLQFHVFHLHLKSEYLVQKTADAGEFVGWQTAQKFPTSEINKGNDSWLRSEPNDCVTVLIARLNRMV